MFDPLCPGVMRPKKELFVSLAPYLAHLNSLSNGGLNIKDLIQSTSPTLPIPAAFVETCTVLAPTQTEDPTALAFAVRRTATIAVPEDVPVPKAVQVLITKRTELLLETP